MGGLPGTGARGVLCALAVVGCVVMLSPAATAAPPRAAVPSTPSLSAGPVSQTPDGSGGFIIAGLVTNTGSVAATDIDITLSEYASSGAVVGLDPVPVTTDLVALAPGETGGFSADLTGDDGSLLAGFDHAAVTGITSDADPVAPNHTFTVTISADTANPDGSHSIIGTVRNDGSAEADGIQIDFVFDDAAGRPVDTDFTFPDNPADLLAAGATDTFDEEYDGPAYATVTAVAEGTVGDGSGGTSPPSCAPCVPVARVGGPDRVQTAVLASRASYPALGSARAVVLARSDTFPDALSGGPLAARLHAPLLLTPPAGLSAGVATEIARVAPRGSTVYLLGGTGALAPAVATAVKALGDNAVRVFGQDRYGTAVAVAELEGSPSVVFEATGTGFADALSAVPAAVGLHASVLLTDGQQQAPATARYLAGLPSSTRYAVGGSAAAADPTATAVFGSDRYATSSMVASMFFAAPTAVGFATGTAFPDALGAGPALGVRSAPLLLLPPGPPLTSSLIGYLAAVGGGVTSAEVFGGESAVPAAVVSAAQDALALAGSG